MSRYFNRDRAEIRGESLLALIARLAYDFVPTR